MRFVLRAAFYFALFLVTWYAFILFMGNDAIPLGLRYALVVSAGIGAFLLDRKLSRLKH
jgi:hypothetical protein